jgi:mannose-6-phosphate isomerase-like protein (cupin superfamily)
LYISEAQLRDIMQKSPARFSSRLISDTTHSTAFIRLDKPDVPHAHGRWSEVFVIKEGSGILETNGTITGVTGTNSATHRDMFVDAEGKPVAPQAQPAVPATRPPTPGDLAGTAIEGGKQQRVAPGDVILIPAGVPHRWLQIDQPVVYLDIKFPKAE